MNAPNTGEAGVARVLLAEDDAVNRRIGMRVLKNLGFAPECAENGAQAVAMHGATPYEAILMDCDMPDVDGYAATALIRRAEEGGSRGHVVIIAMTANALPGQQEKCLAAGMDDFLTKPMRPELVRQKLSEWLARKGESR